MEKVLFERLWLRLSDTRLMKCTLDTGLKRIVTYIQCSKAIYHLLSGDIPKGWATVHRDLDRQEKQAYRNHIKNENKQKTPPWNPAPGEKHPQAPLQAANSQPEISFAGKALGSWRTRGSMSQTLQQIPAAPGAVSGRALPVGWEWILLCCPVLLRQTWSVVSLAWEPTPGQEKYGCTGASPAKGHWGD